MAAHSMSKTGTSSQAGPTFNATSGAVNESGQYQPGDIGGEAAHQLTITELARHRHSTPTSGGSGGGGSNFGGTSSSGNTGYIGGDDYHENRPPYYALAFIMRIS